MSNTDINISADRIAVEGLDSVINFRVELSEPVVTTTDFYYGVYDVTAQGGSDFVGQGLKKLTFFNGERVKNVSVSIVNDSIPEGDEFFTFNVYQDAAGLNFLSRFVATITDTIQSNGTFALNAAPYLNVENLVLTGTGNWNGTGNAGNNQITGNGGANVLSGLDGNDLLLGMAGADTLLGGVGNDTLDGGAGADSMVGGAGDDLYIVDNVGDKLSREQIVDGIDTVQSSINFTLPGISSNPEGTYIENLALTGAAINGTGNELNNRITGNGAANVLDGGAGNDSLLGMAGNDTLRGGTGDDCLDGGLGANSLVGGVGNDVYVLNSKSDTIIENAGEGNDWVEAGFAYSIATRPTLENIRLVGDGVINATGNGFANILIGNSAANILTGNAGNDILDGGGGFDTLRGGMGDDVYILSANPWDFIDLVSEPVDGGVDTVRINGDYILPANIERLELVGDGNFSGRGNNLSNVLIGNSGNNYLEGRGGADILIGGGGNDTFFLESAQDQPREGEGANEGSDWVFVNFPTETAYSLLDSGPTMWIENVRLLGEASRARGNSLGNILLGNESGDTLEGMGGNDLLDGGEGEDCLVGGIGSDTYNVVLSDNDRIVENSDPNPTLKDRINLTHTGLAGVLYSMAANTEIISYNSAIDIQIAGNDQNNTFFLQGTAMNTVSGGAGNDIYVVENGLHTLIEEAGAGRDTVESWVSFRLPANVDDLLLIGTASTSGIGNDLPNFMRGNAAGNSIDGQVGNDSIYGGDGKDTLLGQAGNDFLHGESGDDFLRAHAGDDTLVGGTGIDTMFGGVGNDVYEVDSPADVVVELASQGTDLVRALSSFTLPDNVENLELFNSLTRGTGNSMNNVITSNSNSHFLDGGLGADTMIGGGGNDTFYVDNAGDIVTELLNEGADFVYTALNNYTLPANVEMLGLLTGVLNGNGNELSNRIFGNNLANQLNGFGGEDFINGLAGSDTMRGGTGNDTYVVDAAGDSVVEAVNEGRDKVVSYVNYRLPANVEILSLAGTASISGTGNELDNIVYGNDAANITRGENGNDILIGGGGNDTLIGSVGNDTLTGGTGADIFDYVTSNAFSGSAFGNDIIRDFSRVEGDKIRLGKTTFGLSSPVGVGLLSGEFASVPQETQVGTSSALIVHSQQTGNLYYNPDRSAVGGDIWFATVEKTSPLASDFIVA